MTRKRIQLRGISRVPSNRLTSDGGCSESMNVQCDNDEITPAPTPEDMADDFGLPSEGVEGDIMYIHRQPNYRNLVFMTGGDGAWSLSAYCRYVGQEASLVSMGSIAFEPTNFSSVGNTVIASSSEGVAYFLYKDGAYRYLGDEIPIPDMTFAYQDVSSSAIGLDEWKNALDDVTKEKPVNSVAYGAWKARVRGSNSMAVAALYYDATTKNPADEFYKGEERESKIYELQNWSVGVKGDVLNETVKGFVGKIWGQVEALINYNSVRGILNLPIFVRYAVRLYDGSIYWVSDPILIRADMSDPVAVFLTAWDQKATTDSVMHYKYTSGLYILKEAYKVLMSISNNMLYDGWDDLVESVDIFFSDQITQYDKTRIVIEEGDASTQVESFGIDLNDNNYKAAADGDNFWQRALLDPYGVGNDKEQEKILLKFSVFHLVKAYSLDEIKELATNEPICLQEHMNMDPDNLGVQEALVEPYQSNHRLQGFDSSSYNGRLLAYNAKQRLARGLAQIHGIGTTSGTAATYKACYFVNTGEGIRRSVFSDGVILAPSGTEWYGWVAYPDARCEQTVLRIYMEDEIKYVSIKMKAHPTLNIAYAFVGWGKVLSDTTNSSSSTEISSSQYIPSFSGISLSSTLEIGDSTDDPYSFSGNICSTTFSTTGDVSVVETGNATVNIQAELGGSFTQGQSALSLDGSMGWYLDGAFVGNVKLISASGNEAGYLTRQIGSSIPSATFSVGAGSHTLSIYVSASWSNTSLYSGATAIFSASLNVAGVGTITEYTQSSDSSDSSVSSDVWPAEEDMMEYMPSQLLQSGSLNPFVFPAEGRITVGSGNILAVATVSRAISAGQFGQFPLYVFTSEGIFALASSSEGTFAQASPLSRDVAYAGSVASIDQGVAFLSDKGVMVVSGGDVRCISESMYGLSDTPSWTGTTIANHATTDADRFASMAEILSGEPQFRAFMQNASLAYDYAGGRLLAFSPDYPFMFVYRFSTGTWHTLYCEWLTGGPVRYIESYPDCTIASQYDASHQKIFNYATGILDTQSTALPAIIVTRALNLDDIDGYKTIWRLRTRREMAADTYCRCLLMASDDLRTWRSISSLRGPSHRFYRIGVAIAGWKPGDRLDFIDLEYGQRFFGKIR